MSTPWRDRLDARIDRCTCGAWRWDGLCATCGHPVMEMGEPGRPPQTWPWDKPLPKPPPKPRPK